jgi:hypothetical protein
MGSILTRINISDLDLHRNRRKYAETTERDLNGSKYEP